VGAGDLVALVEEQFGLAVKAATSFYDAPEKAVYRLDVDGAEPLVTRLFPASRPAERVAGDAAILRYLAAEGVPAEQVVVALDGSSWLQLGDRGLLVTRFIPGGPPDLTTEALEQMGALLGRLHALPAPAAGDGHLARRAGSLPREDLAAARDWLASAEPDLPPQHRAFHDTLRHAVHATHDCEDLPLALTHPDCHPGNMVQTPDGRIVLFDWDGAGLGPRIAALGVLLYTCAISPPFGPPVAPDVSRVDHIMRGYTRHTTLSPVEQSHLPDAIRFRPLAVAARTLAETAIGGEPLPTAAWWAGYDRAGEVAEEVRRFRTGRSGRRRGGSRRAGRRSSRPA
jgi:Ser/Thr protein kinase RdoA (MazF antagonist)